MFENGQPEVLFGFLKNFNKSIDITGTTTFTGQINWLFTMVRGEALKKFYELSGQKNGTTNTNLRELY